MASTPNTIGVVLLFLIIFFGCIFWATRSEPGLHDSAEEDLQAIGKAS